VLPEKSPGATTPRDRRKPTDHRDEASTALRLADAVDGAPAPRRGRAPKPAGGWGGGGVFRRLPGRLRPPAPARAHVLAAVPEPEALVSHPAGDLSDPAPGDASSPRGRDRSRPPALSTQHRGPRPAQFPARVIDVEHLGAGAGVIGRSSRRRHELRLPLEAVP
jgi:hypothetical protein